MRRNSVSIWLVVLLVVGCSHSDPAIRAHSQDGQLAWDREMKEQLDELLKRVESVKSQLGSELYEEVERELKDELMSLERSREDQLRQATELKELLDALLNRAESRKSQIDSGLSGLYQEEMERARQRQDALLESFREARLRQATKVLKRQASALAMELKQRQATERRLSPEMPIPNHPDERFSAALKILQQGQEERAAPKFFKSWSLFLVCDPGWLHGDQGAALNDLYTRYRAFGKTTGPEHAAVWFEQKHGALDIERSVVYCRHFALTPSEGPHIVVTTVYPNDWTPGTARIVLAFSSKSPQEIQAQLSKLNDQIAAQRLSQEDLNSAGWWQGWVQALEAACRWLDKVKWGVDAKPVKVERSGAC